MRHSLQNITAQTICAQLVLIWRSSTQHIQTIEHRGDIHKYLHATQTTPLRKLLNRNDRQIKHDNETTIVATNVA